LRYFTYFVHGGKSPQQKPAETSTIVIAEFVKVIFVVKMATEDDYRLREIQREYLDFLDDDVGALLLLLCLCSRCRSYKLNDHRTLNKAVDKMLLFLLTNNSLSSSWSIA